MARTVRPMHNYSIRAMLRSYSRAWYCTVILGTPPCVFMMLRDLHFTEGAGFVTTIAVQHKRPLVTESCSVLTSIRFTLYSQTIPYLRLPSLFCSVCHPPCIAPQSAVPCYPCIATSLRSSSRLPCRLPLTLGVACGIGDFFVRHGIVGSSTAFLAATAATKGHLVKKSSVCAQYKHTTVAINSCRSNRSSNNGGLSSITVSGYAQ